MLPNVTLEGEYADRRHPGRCHASSSLVVTRVKGMSATTIRLADRLPL